MQEIVEYQGQNSYFPTGCHCFIKGNNNFTTKTVQKNIRISFKPNKNEKMLWTLLEFNHSEENRISTLVVLMERE